MDEDAVWKTAGPDRAVKSSANTMCRQVTASAVTDIGLGTAWYIAHGIGHNMGLDHDDDRADGADCPNYKYIMSSEKNTAPTSYMWSPCSRTRIQTFLNSGNLSWCLNDPPVLTHAPTLPPRNRGKLPGEIINGDQQCREAFSEDFKHVSREKLRVRIMIMSVNDGSYKTAEHCGVTMVRELFSLLIQESLMAQIVESISFILTFCPTSCSDPLYVALSLTDGFPSLLSCQDPCGLYCGSGRRWRKAGNVDDGTRCSRYGLDVCIQGRCQSVGCDHELGSGARFDRCRVCDGNGTSCVHVTGNFTEQWNKLGPRNARVIVELPVGTLNAKFKEMERTPDAIGIQNSAGQYLSKGNSRTPRKGKIFHAAGARISLSQPTTSSADELAIEGPTTASLRVVLIRNGRRGTKGVRYHYCRPLFAYETTGESSTTFEWKTSDWSPCSVSCSTGLQTRDIWCVRSDDKTPASFTACGTQKMPVKKRDCNAQACIEK
ncbi:hypothetical protein pdam_00001302 [Pocillopora damicornis]|uniref:Peptidase M12B domain-containing protein n=1 Tax=Pocillopora damicornis TaxID=46731 RepID=A0A3M6TL63_POCDA|nr:hypothetical protein pdam_00001302 [Pocillopora damicornis]